MVRLLYTDPHGMSAPTEMMVSEEVAAVLLVNDAFRRADTPVPMPSPEPPVNPETLVTET